MCYISNYISILVFGSSSGTIPMLDGLCLSYLLFSKCFKTPYLFSPKFIFDYLILFLNQWNLDCSLTFLIWLLVLWWCDFGLQAISLAILLVSFCCFGLILLFCNFAFILLIIDFMFLLNFPIVQTSCRKCSSKMDILSLACYIPLDVVNLIIAIPFLFVLVLLM